MGWNRQKITDWMAMAGAVSALVLVNIVVTQGNKYDDDNDTMDVRSGQT